MENGWDNKAEAYPDTTMGFDFSSFGDKLMTSVGNTLETSLVSTAVKAEAQLQSKLQGELNKILGLSSPPSPVPLPQPVNYTIMQPAQMMQQMMPSSMNPETKKYLMYAGFGIGGLFSLLMYGIGKKVLGSSPRPLAV